MVINEDLFEGSVEIDPSLQRDQAISNLVVLPACKGIILFADSENRPVQMLIAGNIRRTARARLYTQQIPETTKRPEIVSIVRHVYYLCCHNDFKAGFYHYRLAKTIWPDTYLEHISLPKLNLVKINPTAKWPVFSVVSSPKANKDEIIFAPFPSRKSVVKFVKSLENAFLLCHRSELAPDPDKALSCPYLQMEKCPAPCVGKITLEQYHKQVDNALTAASGNIDQFKSALSKRMEEFCAELKFEQANQVKNQLENLNYISGCQYNWTGRLDDLAVLHIDLSAKVKIEGKRKKTQTMDAFLITREGIMEFPQFDLDGVANLHKTLSAQLNRPAEFDSPGHKITAQQLSILCSFLFKSKRPGIWINLNCKKDRKGQIPEESELMSVIEKQFGLA